MRPRFPRTPRPVLLIAHRGVPVRFPENTLPSFQAAVDEEADVLEFDVQTTRDGRLVVIHDETLERTTDGRGRVRERTFEEIRKLDAGGWLSPEFQGLRVPAFEEALDAVGGKTVLNIELKQYGAEEPGFVDRVHGEIISRGIQETVLFSSFHFDLLRRLREIDPEIPYAALFQFARGRRPVEEAAALGARYLGCHHRLVNEKRMEEARKAGILVCPYTVDTIRRAASLVDLGVAALITNNLPAMKEFIAERFAPRHGRAKRRLHGD